MVDATSGDITQIASLEGNPIIGIDAWVESAGETGGHNNPLRAVQMEQEFFIRTNKGRHDGRAKDYLVETVLTAQRWVVPQVVFRALFGAR